jgi:hypothetical protein
MLKKRKKVPLRSLEQIKKCRPKCRKHLEAYKNHDFVLDDESYFTLRNYTASGNDSFYTDNKENTPGDIEYKKKAKFEQKLLV